MNNPERTIGRHEEGRKGLGKSEWMNLATINIVGKKKSWLNFYVVSVAADTAFLPTHSFWVTKGLSKTQHSFPAWGSLHTVNWSVHLFLAFREWQVEKSQRITPLFVYPGALAPWGVNTLGSLCYRRRRKGGPITKRPSKEAPCEQRYKN